MATQRTLSYRSWKSGVNRARLDPSELVSPWDDVLKELKGLMGSEPFHAFFNKVHKQYRWSDTARYERILRYRLRMIKRNGGGQS